MRSMMFGEEATAEPRGSGRARWGTTGGWAPAWQQRKPESEPAAAPVGESSPGPVSETTSSAAEPEAETKTDEPAAATAEEPAFSFGNSSDTVPESGTEQPTTPSTDEHQWSSAWSAAAAPSENSTAETEPSEPVPSTYSWDTHGEVASTDGSTVEVTSGEAEAPAHETEPAAEPGVDGAAAGTETGAATPTVNAAGEGTAGTLVIIEDDAKVADYYSTLFRGNGYRVEVANDGVSGVDVATRVRPDVILLDVMMPRQNGILVLQTLRASDETRDTPVVVLSNFSEPTLIKRALQLGALEYVIKTQAEGAQLLNAVPRWMNREKAFAA
jgi:CheY-like chemotaxis protein